MLQFHGFRKGKATDFAIKKHYKSQIDESLKRALAEEAYHNTVFEKNIKPLGVPQFKSMLLNKDLFTCSFILHKKPDFELQPLDNITLPRPHEQISVENLTEQLIQDLRIKHGEMVSYTEDCFVQEKDSIIISYEGFVDGVKQENLCSQGETITVGSSSLTDFDVNILGMKVGESRSFDVKAPNNALPSLKDKTITFKVELLAGSKIIPMPLNDDFAKKLNKESFQQLREFIYSSALNKVSTTNKMQLTNNLSNVLVSMHDFKVPEWLVLTETKVLTQKAKINFDSLEDADKKVYMDMAEKNVKLSFILDKVREEYPDAQLTEQEIIDVMKRGFGKDIDNKVFMQLAQNGQLQVLASRIKDEHALDIIMKKVKIVE